MEPPPIRTYEQLSPRQKHHIDVFVFLEVVEKRMQQQALGHTFPIGAENIPHITARREAIATDMQQDTPAFYDYGQDIPEAMQDLNNCLRDGVEDVRGDPVAIHDLIEVLEHLRASMPIDWEAAAVRTTGSYEQLPPRMKRQVDAVVVHELVAERIDRDGSPLPREETVALIAARRDEVAADIQKDPPLFYNYAKVLPQLMEAMHHYVAGDVAQVLGSPLDISDIIELMDLPYPGKPRSSGERDR